jgi:uncharacterized protein with PIN domain
MAYRCDRCNRYFEETQKIAVQAYIKNNSARIAGLYKYNSDGNQRDIDICPECYRSLEEWMEGGAKSDKEEHC